MCQLQGQSSSVCRASRTREDFLRIAAYRQVGDIDEADHIFRVHDEGGALADARLDVKNAQLLREIALVVGEHGEGQVLQVGMAVAPRVVHILRVHAGAQNLRIAVSELLVCFAECGDLRGTDESEILGPEEVNLPLAGIALLSDGFKSLFEVQIDNGGQFKCGEILSNSKHA